MQEANTSVVEIKEFSPEIFKLALEFLYTGWTKSVFGYTHAVHLLPLADMYQLSDLADHCVEKVKLSISTDCVTEVLLLAVRLNQKDLKSSAFAFLKSMSEKDGPF